MTKTTPFTRLPGALALLALAAAAAPALAGVTIYPGANCRTEGASEMLVNGELRSAEIVVGPLNDNNITKFSCPVVLTRANSNYYDSSVSATARPVSPRWRPRCWCSTTSPAPPG
jgi:hypothetical protein